MFLLINGNDLLFWTFDWHLLQLFRTHRTDEAGVGRCCFARSSIGWFKQVTWFTQATGAVCCPNVADHVTIWSGGAREIVFRHALVSEQRCQTAITTDSCDWLTTEGAKMEHRNADFNILLATDSYKVPYHWWCEAAGSWVEGRGGWAENG